MLEDDKRLNWYKYNAKLIKQGKLSPEREQMIHELEEMRSGEHTGGRHKTAYDDDTASPTMTMTGFCCPNVLISAHFKQ